MAPPSTDNNINKNENETEHFSADTSRLFNLARQPCFKGASFSASGVGIAAGAVAWVRRRSVIRTLDFVAGGWAMGFVGTWFICRRRLAARNAALQDAVSRQSNVVHTLPGGDDGDDK